MNKERYIQECYRQLFTHFELVKKKKVDEQMKHRIQGFINAGEFLGLFSRDEAIHIIDEVHLNVFGITKEQRKAHADIVKKATKHFDEHFFDIPAIERKMNR